jgi:hypothetical protein
MESTASKNNGCRMPAMHIVSITWARNVADIIESFVRHHCALVDRMIIVDNGSRDNTREILNALVREGLLLDIRSDTTVGHAQSQAMTHLIEELRTHHAPDWILPIDADEFLVTTGAGDLRASIAALPTDMVPRLPWRSYIPMPKDPQEECVLRRICHRKMVETPQWYKVMIPRAALQDRVILPMGSHTLLQERTREDFCYMPVASLALAHFPVRSPDQIAAKVLAGWPRHCTDPQRIPGSNFQWEALFSTLSSGGEIDATTLQNHAIEYATANQWHSVAERWKEQSLQWLTGSKVYANGAQDALLHDPVPCTFSLRYMQKAQKPITTLAQTAMELAEEVARMRKLSTADTEKDAAQKIPACAIRQS